MRATIGSCLAILLVVTWAPFLYALAGYPFTRGEIVSYPNPPVSFQETMADRPSDESFEKLGYRDVSAGVSYTFTLGQEATPCTRKWRGELRGLDWGDRVQLSGPVPGRAGTCDWYSMRIVDSGGEVKAGFGRPGPRKVGQMPGRPRLENPDRMEVSVRRGAPKIEMRQVEKRR